MKAAGLGRAPHHVPVRATALRRKICKPVCFKEDRQDKIDDPTSTRTTPSTLPYGVDPLYGTTALRPVTLGAVASVIYPALTWGTAAAAAAAVLLPGVTGAFLFEGARLTATNKALLASAGASILPAALAKHLIKRSADTGTLASPTYKQVVSSCLLHSVLSLMVLSQAISLRNPVLGITVGGLTGLATITTAYTLMKIRESGQLVPSLRGMLGSALGLVTPRTPAAALYSVLTIGLAAVGLKLITSDPTMPHTMFVAPKTAIDVFASRIAGAAALSNAMLMFAVKQTADSGRQGSIAGRTLNAGLASWAALSAAIKGYTVWTGLAVSVASTWMYIGLMAVTAAFCGYSWYTAPSSV